MQLLVFLIYVPQFQLFFTTKENLKKRDQTVSFTETKTRHQETLGQGADNPEKDPTKFEVRTPKKNSGPQWDLGPMTSRRQAQVGPGGKNKTYETASFVLPRAPTRAPSVRPHFRVGARSREPTS